MERNISLLRILALLGILFLGDFFIRIAVIRHADRVRSEPAKIDRTEDLSKNNKPIGFNHNFEVAYYLRGVTYDNLGNFPQALYYYSLAITSYTNNIENNPAFDSSDNNPITKANLAWCYHNRAKVYYHLKQYDKAWADVYKAQKLGHPFDLEFLNALKRASGKDEHEKN